MRNLLYVLSSFFFLIGMYAVITNWWGFWSSCVKKQKVGSCVPLIAGILVMTAFLLYPQNDVKKLWWVGLLIDPCSVPGILYTVWQMYKKKHK